MSREMLGVRRCRGDVWALLEVSFLGLVLFVERRFTPVLWSVVFCGFLATANIPTP